MKTFCESPEDLLSKASDIARELQAGEVVGLIGDLGAGKTHFTKGLLAGLGFAGEVTSPTFSLVQEYLGGRLPVFHFDFYRIEKEEELLALGWDDYLAEEGLVVVEWAERFSRLLPRGARWWRLQAVAENRRTLEEIKWE
ncbi:MAG: tRNA (adenosine(37)-N6)-threonylcarbamoyltransferase complex ATPase subunit type 1 TsaE [Verrucomicrobiota bacterium]